MGRRFVDPQFSDPQNSSPKEEKAGSFAGPI
jgi:hypothetical protein